MHTLRAPIAATCLWLAAFAGPAAAASASYLETWSHAPDTAGWATYSCCGAAVSNPGLAGNPGGFLLASSNSSILVGATTSLGEATGPFAPGLWRASFDLLIFDELVADLMLRFRASPLGTGNGWRHAVGTPVAIDDSGWQSYLIDFDPGWSDAQAMAHGWVQEANINHPTPSWADTMAAVTSTEIRGENGPGMQLGIDNFGLQQLTRRLPLPGSAALAALALLALPRLRRGSTPP